MKITANYNQTQTNSYKLSFKEALNPENINNSKHITEKVIVENSTNNKKILKYLLKGITVLTKTVWHTIDATLTILSKF